ncbi:MAG: DUF6440 family protein [Oscillospiraceae bacterium]|jgi:hypothetical protein|nr:DUF6440 family protein [Oscillospiraceae bacterium]
MAAKPKLPKRFEVVHKETTALSSVLVYRDRNTGVNYLFIEQGYAGGLTVLLDPDGKPVVTAEAEVTK